jgi:prepilin-type N-terminal cleavage/methylation domain-containing protein
MRGYSLLECICSLSIVALLAAGVAQIVHRSTTVLGATSDNLEERFALTKSALVIRAALAAHERSHLPGLVSITNGSNPTTSYGGRHPVSSLSGNTSPRSASSIVSIVEVSPRHRGRIIKSSFSADTISVDVCGGVEIPTPNEFRSHIVVGIQGLCQLTGTPEPLNNGCFTITGRVVTGIVSQTCQTNALLEYLPVTRELSIYIDRTGELRLISHVGSRIIENQPIVRSLRSLQITPMKDATYAIIYRIDLYANATRSHRFFVPAGLTEETIWNEILL